MKCLYCQGNTEDDIYGNCLACGAPRTLVYDVPRISEVIKGSHPNNHNNITIPENFKCGKCFGLDIDNPTDRKIILHRHTCKKCHHWMAIENDLCWNCQ